MATHSIHINRAPVLTLWAAIVAERLGHPRATALTLGKAVAGLNAQAKGRRLGVFEPAKPARAAMKSTKPTPAPPLIELLGRAVPVVATPKGARALVKDALITPESVERYLEGKFGGDLGAVEEAMRALARAHAPRELAAVGYTLYERFRPAIPEGVSGWGAKGVLDLDLLRRLAKS